MLSPEACLLFLFKNYFDSVDLKIVAFHAVVGNKAEGFRVLFTQFALLLTSCKTMVPYLSQDISIDMVKIQNISITTGIFHIVLL